MLSTTLAPISPCMRCLWSRGSPKSDDTVVLDQQLLRMSDIFLLLSLFLSCAGINFYVVLCVLIYIVILWFAPLLGRGGWGGGGLFISVLLVFLKATNNKYERWITIVFILGVYLCCMFMCLNSLLGVYLWLNITTELDWIVSDCELYSSGGRGEFGRGLSTPSNRLPIFLGGWISGCRIRPAFL